MKLQLVLRNASSRILFGKHAPRVNEILIVRPTEITWFSKAGFKREDSARVIGGDWDRKIAPLESLPKYFMALEYLKTYPKRTWEDVGAYEYCMRLISLRGTCDGCCSLQDVKTRYQRLDELIERLQSGGDYDPRKRKGHSDEVYVHLDREGGLLFGGGGQHRLAIFKYLGVHTMPVQLGVVHANLKREIFLSLRKRRLEDSDEKQHQQHTFSETE